MSSHLQKKNGRKHKVSNRLMNKRPDSVRLRICLQKEILAAPPATPNVP
jgi:hypothetical protein